MRSTAALIRADMGVEAVQIDLAGGIPTASRANQWRMAVNMQQFAQAIAAFYVDMVTRTRSTTYAGGYLEVRPGGARKRQPGHDHGHGNTMFVWAARSRAAET